MSDFDGNIDIKLMVKDQLSELIDDTPKHAKEGWCHSMLIL